MEKGIDVEAELKPEQLKLAANAVQAARKQKSILEKRPDLAKILGSEIDKAIGAIAAKNITNVSDKAFNKESVVINMNVSQIKKLGTDGSSEQVNAVKKTVDALKAKRSAMPPDEQKKLSAIESEMNKNPVWQ